MDRAKFFGGIVASTALGLGVFVRPVRALPTPGLDPLALASGWLGERATAARLLGRIVVVDVFTFECINCTRVLPNLKKLAQTYAADDLAIVGVHTPEVPSYQRRPAYLARETRANGIVWPVAIDNDARIWNAYGVSAWPTQLIFDRSGRLVATIVGDGRDAEVNAVVRALARRSPRLR